MEGLLLYWLAVLFSFSDHFADPIHVAWKGMDEARELECERLPQKEAHRRYPAEVPPTAMRSQTLMQIDALVCHRRIVRLGEREARDEAILTHLSEEVDQISAQAIAAAAKDTDFYVDAYYPDIAVAMKIANATRHALADSSRRVSSQAPLPAAGDVDVLLGLPLQQALPVACARLQAEGTLKPNEAFLAVAVLRPQETQLHAGLCQQGLWRWLR